MIEQRSPEWFAQRCGKITASRFKDVMATIKSGEAAAYANYRAELVCERLTGKVAERFSTQAMQLGTEREPMARQLFEVETGLLVGEVGFILIGDLPAGASPDGIIVEENAALEIKCPGAAAHIEYLQLPEGTCPSEYKWQVQGQMLATGCTSSYFVSYNPDFPEELQLTARRVQRDDVMVAQLVEKITTLDAQVNLVVEKLLKIKGSK